MGSLFPRTLIEKALEAQQSRFEQLFENANDGIIIVSRDGHFMAVNQKFTELVGLSKEEIIGKTTEIFLPGGFAQSLERIERIIKEGKLGPFELELTTPLGKKVLSFNAFAYFEGDTPVGIMNIARDVTEERRRRQEQETLYQLAHDLARSPDIPVMTEHLFARAHSLLGADYGFLMLADAEGSELRGVAAHGIDAGAFRQERIEVRKELAPVVLAFQKKQPVVIADMARSPLVSERLHEKYHFVGSVWVVPLMSGEGAVGVFCVGYATRREATSEELRLLQLLGNEAALAIERARLTEELQESEGRYQRIFENASDAIITFDLNGMIISMNRGAEQMLGWSREELVGQHYRKISTPQTIALAQERNRRALAGEKLPPVFETELVCRDGRIVPVEANSHFTYNREGMRVSFQGIYRDISARKELEQQRADFLAMLTHDIRTPLGVILGYAGMLREMGGLSPGQEDMVRRQEIGTQTILSLANNYLDLSKIETGHLTLVKNPLAINSILYRVGQQYEAEARCLHLTLELHLQEELPAVEGDALALERVFTNLVHNALKFTPELGQVTISSARQNSEVVVAVADTGPGIAPEELPFIFERYRRAAASQGREGTGLGLFIAKVLVEAHGGRIEVESTLGLGSCFSVFLPMVSADPAEA